MLLFQQLPWCLLSWRGLHRCVGAVSACFSHCYRSPRSPRSPFPSPPVPLSCRFRLIAASCWPHPILLAGHPGLLLSQGSLSPSPGWQGLCLPVLSKVSVTQKSFFSRSRSKTRAWWNHDSGLVLCSLICILVPAVYFFHYSTELSCNLGLHEQDYYQWGFVFVFYPVIM